MITAQELACELESSYQDYFNGHRSTMAFIYSNSHGPINLEILQILLECSGNSRLIEIFNSLFKRSISLEELDTFFRYNTRNLSYEELTDVANSILHSELMEYLLSNHNNPDKALRYAQGAKMMIDYGASLTFSYDVYDWIDSLHENPDSSTGFVDDVIQYAILKEESVVDMITSSKTGFNYPSRH